MWPRLSPPKAPICACSFARPAISPISKASPATPIVGDLAEPESFAPALDGCDAVVHVAADYRLWIPDPKRCTAPMWMARANCCAWPAKPACRALSTPPAWPPCTSAPTASSSTKTRRSRSKTWSATTSARSSWPSRRRSPPRKDGQQVIILNPTTPIGPNDAKPTPTGRIFVDFLNGKFPAYVDTGLNLVDVAEVARTHVAALTKGTPGRRYILGGENLTLKQILDKMSAITGIPSPTVKIPFAVAATYAFFEEWITGRIRGKEPRATLEEVRMGRKKMFASSARAQQELGFRIVPVYPAMRAAIEWFRANGYAPQARRMTRIAIIAAMPGELKPLVRGWQHSRRNGVDLWAQRDEDEWVAACAGAGSSRRDPRLCRNRRGRPRSISSFPSAGPEPSAELAAGTAYNVAGVIDVRTGERFRLRCGRRRTLACHQPQVADQAEKRRLASTYGAALVDMEAAAVARLAQMRGIPFYAIKGVSDALNDQLPDFNRFIDAPGQVSAAASFVLFSLLRPWYWPALIRMGENSKKASQSIAESLLDFLR